jgi:hypothetical protein
VVFSVTASGFSTLTVKRVESNATFCPGVTVNLAFETSGVGHGVVSDADGAPVFTIVTSPVVVTLFLGAVVGTKGEKTRGVSSCCCAVGMGDGEAVELTVGLAVALVGMVVVGDLVGRLGAAEEAPFDGLLMLGPWGAAVGVAELGADITTGVSV